MVVFGHVSVCDSAHAKRAQYCHSSDAMADIHVCILLAQLQWNMDERNTASRKDIRCAFGLRNAVIVSHPRVLCHAEVELLRYPVSKDSPGSP